MALETCPPTFVVTVRCGDFCYKELYLSASLRRHGFDMGEIKAKQVGAMSARPVEHVPEHFPQCRVKQVRSRVIPAVPHDAPDRQRIDRLPERYLLESPFAEVHLLGQHYRLGVVEDIFTSGRITPASPIDPPPCGMGFH